MGDARFAVLVPWRPRLLGALGPAWSALAWALPPRRLEPEVRVVSPAGARASGWRLACPVADAAGRVHGRTLRVALRRARRLGADVIGVPAPVTRLPAAGVAVTDGRALALVALLQALATQARQRWGPEARWALWAVDAELARACARMVARWARHLTLVGETGLTRALAAELLRATGLAATVVADADLAGRADVVVLAGIPATAARPRLPGAGLWADAARAAAPCVDTSVAAGAPTPPVQLPGDGPSWPASWAEAALWALAGPAQRTRLQAAALAERVTMVADLAARHGLRLVAAGGPETVPMPWHAGRASPDGGSEWA